MLNVVANICKFFNEIDSSALIQVSFKRQDSMTVKLVEIQFQEQILKKTILPILGKKIAAEHCEHHWLKIAENVDHATLQKAKLAHPDTSGENDASFQQLSFAEVLQAYQVRYW